MPHASSSSTRLPSPSWSSGGCWDRPAGRCRCARSTCGWAASTATCGAKTATAPRWGWEASTAKSWCPSGSSPPSGSTRPGTRERPWGHSSWSSSAAGPRSRRRCATSRGRRAMRSSSPAWRRAWRRATTGWPTCWRRHCAAASNPKETHMQKITPFLWFDGKAEEAVNFYVSIFKNSKVVRVTRYGEAGPGPKGTVMSATFQLDGQEFYALNGGPMFTFSPAISFFVKCETQPEIDEMWEKLSAGGEKQRCGWLKDKYGVSWQIVPPVLGEMLSDEDAEKSKRVMEAMLQMDKIDIDTLKRAYLNKAL